MARARWILRRNVLGASGASGDSSGMLVKPVFYHCISRVVDRKLVFGPAE